ncbi:capsule assembly Wzi family protein [Spirosoma sp. KCTC 42546]|uniref:capsule assembly Wzi family protein n=1 Tax=Spirosoma sp. KCTC 42546 TaxID=2520506 RepID=UPI00115758E3|nr:capsule assembly Wzi family protein [Spirosoma sp. KCTC 42546]QDK83080.1 capsule assembly Wzi family protein [Spirosoma sp. KCTC 42546]
MHTCSKSGLLVTLFLVVIVPLSLLAQPIRKPSQYSAEIGTYIASSTETPFWLRANQYGIVANRSPVATFRAGVYSDYDTRRHSTGRWRDSKYDFGYGLNIVANKTQNQLPYERNVLLPEAYVKVRRGIFEAYIGRQREKFGLADSTLSTGSYAWSGNAMPIPKIQVSIPVFTPIGFTKGWVAVQGTFAHGYMDANGYIRNSMLHQKSLYLRFGRQQDVVRVYSGVNHQVVWGGKIADPTNVPSSIQTDGKLPSGLLNYFYVVSTLSPRNTDTSQYNYFDLTNRIGNHLGSVDLAVEVDLVRHTLYFYRQSIYEDGSLFYLINIADGLNGMRIRRNDPKAIVRDILLEFLNTTSQGGPEFVIDDPDRRGKDDYFNHQQYRDGWAYRQHTIGTPFIPPALGSQDQYPNGTFTGNNRVYVFHAGIAGSLPVRWRVLSSPLAYQAKLSFSRNLGTYNNPYTTIRNQFSAYASVMAPLDILGGLQFTASIATDAGNLYQNSVGTFISVRKLWLTNYSK